MFNNCQALKNITMKHWHFLGEVNLSKMFQNCTNLQSIDLSTCFINGVINISCMFNGCTQLMKLDLSHFTLKDNCSTINMITSCSQLKELNLSNWRLLPVTVVMNMFCGLNNLQVIYLPEIYKSLGVHNPFLRMRFQIPQTTQIEWTRNHEENDNIDDEYEEDENDEENKNEKIENEMNTPKIIVKEDVKKFEFNIFKQEAINAFRSYPGNWVMDSFTKERQEVVLNYLLHRYNGRYSAKIIQKAFEGILVEIAQVELKPFNQE